MIFHQMLHRSNILSLISLIKPVPTSKRMSLRVNQSRITMQLEADKEYIIKDTTHLKVVSMKINQLKVLECPLSLSILPINSTIRAK